jgi:hypothetical protein
MRECDSRRMHTRVQGRQAIARSLARVALRLARFAQCRAVTRDDQMWAARLADVLS